MKKDEDQMLPEYDFSGRKGIRGRYSKAMKSGYSIKTYNGKKVVSDRFYAAIEPDVKEHFPDSKSINVALRKIISRVSGTTKRTAP